MSNRQSRPLGGRLPRATAFGAAAVVLLVSCGGDAKETAEALIESKLAEEIGLGELVASCDQPDQPVEGETFSCTATTPTGATIDFVGTFTSDDSINVHTTNMLTAADVTAIVPAIADAVGNTVDAPVAASDITCPDGSVILDADGNFECEILDTSTGDRYPITIKTGGLVPGGGPKDLGFEIGDLIEP